MTSFVAIIAFLMGIVGLIATSQATFGVGLIGFACLLGILARISQAEVQHRAGQPAVVKADTPRPVTTTVQPPGGKFGFAREKVK